VYDCASHGCFFLELALKNPSITNDLDHRWQLPLKIGIAEAKSVGGEILLGGGGTKRGRKRAYLLPIKSKWIELHKSPTLFRRAHTS